MFVAIDNDDKNIFDIDAWINRTRDDNGGVISSEFAMEILSKTNHMGHIKKILKNIKEKCSDEEKKQYKDFILACVYRRIQTPKAMEDLRALADLCEIREEFERQNQYSKIYDVITCCNSFVDIASSEEFDDLQGERLRVKVCCKKIDFSEKDLKKINCLRLSEGTTVKFAGAKNLPAIIEFASLKPKWISFDKTDFKDVKSLVFNSKEEGSFGVDLGFSYNLPEVLDFSSCKMGFLSKFDFASVKEIKFEDGMELHLWDAINLPEEVDFSKCSKVLLCDCNLSGVKSINFGNLDVVEITSLEGLPEVLDFSGCSEVTLMDCNLSNVRELKFKKGAKVDLRNSTLPRDLDVSMCDDVVLDYSDFRYVSSIKFKDIEQKETAMHTYSGPQRCNISYAKEDTSSNIMNDYVQSFSI